MNHKKKERVYEDILGITIGFLLISEFFDVHWLRYVALALGLVSLASKFMAGLISRAWLQLTRILGTLMSFFLLSVLFFFFLTPLALLFRWMNRKKLMTTDLPSLFRERNHLFVAEDMKNPW